MWTHNLDHSCKNANSIAFDNVVNLIKITDENKCTLSILVSCFENLLELNDSINNSQNSKLIPNDWQWFKIINEKNQNWQFVVT